MAKHTLYGQEAVDKIRDGVSEVVQAVGSTLGPRGRNVAFGRPFGVPGVVHDGVTVAKELLPLKDPHANVAAEILVGSAKDTDNEAGDGTTLTTILAGAIYTEGRKLMAAGHNAMVLRRGIEAAVDHCTAKLFSIAKEIKTADEVKNVATVSAQNERLGNIISQAFKKLGKDAVITVEETSKDEIYVEYKDGMEIDQGWVSPYFMTDEKSQEAIMDNANIIITDKILNDASELQPFFMKLHAEGIENNIVIIAGDVQGQVLGTFVLNKVKGILNVNAIKAPSFGDNQRALLEDLAAATGARLLTQDSGMKLEEITKEDVGKCRRVVSSKDSTAFIDGGGTKAAVKDRVELIKKQLERPNVAEYEMERLQERLAKLTSGIAIINVGANSESEARELKERVIDAVAATKAAYEEGIVAGGETALLICSRDLSKLVNKENPELEVGVRLVADALKIPFKTLMTNSGYDAGEMYAKLEEADAHHGVDVMDGQIKDLTEAGIIDPVKVYRAALQNAASVATMLLTMDTIIVDETKEAEAQVV
jgi:chaperonin GroEL